MLKHLFVVISLSSLCFFLYGILFLILEVEKNACRMTYMFEYPQFVKINFNIDESLKKYGLYAYAEGALTENARNMKFNGAPVIFVPGNSGSFKQARSLASVAIRKGLDNDLNQHLDYFTIDYNEEYSALFGGYLEDQRTFLKQSIFTVLKLYQRLPNSPKQVVLIGHSMGATISMSMLTDELVSNYINSIICLAGPIDRPVINIDYNFEALYRKTNDYFSTRRTFSIMTNDTNYCTNSNIKLNSSNEIQTLDNKLLVTIGGGSRDILVHSGLTSSKYSDVHAMTTAIPNVWLTTDHLCTVWCLQLVIVINRFLYSIISSSNSRKGYDLGQSFIEDKSVRLAKAEHYFVKPHGYTKQRETVLFGSTAPTGDWIEDSRRVFSLNFNGGVNQTLYQMIRLFDSPLHKMLYVEIVNVDSDNWLFGCAANDVYNRMRYCKTGTSLSHLVQKIPSQDLKRETVSLDLHKIKKSFSAWTHIIIRIPPTNQKVKLNVDVNNFNDRHIEIKMPKWYSYRHTPIIDDTLLGISRLKISILDLDESYQSLELKINQRKCSETNHHAVAKVCVPWAKGFDRYQHFNNLHKNPLYVNAPITRPLHYNTTKNPITVELYLDPNCRYSLSYQNSFGGSLSRMVQQHFHWLPAHMTAALLLSFKYQISVTPDKLIFKCGKLHSALIHSSSFFIITATRIFAKLLMSVKVLPEPDNFHQSMLISFIMHGTGMGCLLLMTAGIWLAICAYGSIVHKIFVRLAQLPVPTISALMPLFEKFPITAGGILIAVAFGSCGAVGLICGCWIYFILMSKQYEEYLEEFVFKTAKLIAEKLFGRKFEKKSTNGKKDKTEENLTDEEEICDSDKDQKENQRIDDDNKPCLENSTNDDEKALTISDNSNVANDDTEPNEVDTELEGLLKEAIEQQKKLMEEKTKKLTLERKEYDSIHEGLSSLHFHVTLFLLLCILTILNVPTALSWAKNYNYSRNLSSDPSLFPAVTVLFCLSFLWQFKTPRNVFGYKIVSSILYACGAVCIIYCQDSVYRLNGVISSVFVLITVHQFISPRKADISADEVCPDKELQDRIDKMQAVLADAEQNNIK